MAEKKKPASRKETGRDSRGRFLKGTSGNATGRPKATKEEHDAREMLKAAAPDAVALLISVMADEKVRLDLRTRCAETVMDRVYGKAAQPIEGNLGAEIKIVMEGLEDLSR